MKQFCYVIVSTNGTKHWTRIIAGSEPNMESNWEKENLQRLQLFMAAAPRKLPRPSPATV